MKLLHIDCRRWTGWTLIALIAWALVSTVIVLSYVRVHWQDEAQIVEIARGGIVDKPESWSMLATGDPKIDSQSWAIYYVGGWLLEHAYQLGGHLGPRVLTMSAYALLAFLFGLYLYRKSGDKLLSAMLAVLLWSFPTFQICARGVRADILAMLFVTGSLLLLQLKARTLSGRCLVFVGAGALYALSVLTWISAFLLAPVVLWEMVDRLKFKQAPATGWLVPLLCAALSGGAMLILLLLPFLLRLDQTLAVSQLVWEINTHYASVAGGLLWKEFLSCLIQPPGFYLLGFALLFTRRRFWILALGFAACAFLCMMTKVYSTRFAYFMPYALIGAGVGIPMIQTARLRRTLMVVIAGMMVLAYGRTYVCRNLTDYRVRHHVDYAALKPIVEQRLGRDIAVYADTFELYYLGRELGWKQYHYLVQWVLPPTNLLAKVDYCITDAGGEKKGIVQHLKDNGFTFAFRIDLPLPESDWPTRHIPVLGGIEDFLGPFNVYKRENNGGD